MGPYLIFLLALQLFYTTTLSKVISAPRYAANSITDKLTDYSVQLPPEITNDDDFYEELDEAIATTQAVPEVPENLPMIKTIDDKTEVKFSQPIEAVNIDYRRNTIVLKFHKNNPKFLMKLDPSEKQKQKSLQENFIRFGKRSYEEFPTSNSLDEGFYDKNPGMRLERSHSSTRDARGDNFMRFGRSINNKNDFIRFGRGGNDFMRFGRSAPAQDFMRFGRAPGQDFMRFGRAPGQDFMRFGRAPGQDFMRFGRAPGQDFMRFGRANQDGFMRFGRAAGQDFMRFGRGGQDGFMRFGRASNKDFMRFGRNSPNNPINPNFMRYSRPDNFMRFGRAPPQPTDNFIRFGKSIDKSTDKNSSKPLMGKNELKQAVKLIHEADSNADNENPVDKAIKVLFDKHQQDQNGKAHDNAGDEQTSESNQHNDNDNDNELDSDMDYFFKMSK